MKDMTDQILRRRDPAGEESCMVRDPFTCYFIVVIRKSMYMYDKDLVFGLIEVISDYVQDAEE